jgi:AcrR family transcriptional regulator
MYLIQKDDVMENISRRDREKMTRETEIIQAAEKVFRLNGFEEASMDKIAREAQFTKRTLYQYFSSKEELFFAVVQKGFLQLQNALQLVSQQDATAFIKIQQLSRQFYRFYQEYPEFFRLLNQVGLARQNDAGTSENQQRFLTVNDAFFHSLAAIITEGHQDGSINPDLDAEKTSLSLVFLLTGFINQLALTGKSFSANFSLDIQDFSYYTLDLILTTLKNKGQEVE